MTQKKLFELAVKIISSFFYLGYSPVSPGTLASLAGVLIYLFLIQGNFKLHLAIFLTAAASGFLVSKKAEELFRQKDAPQIVIDEVAGMLASLLFMPYGLRSAIAGFLVFRIMDALKPYPIYKIERFSYGLGVMLDDLFAAFYANITILIAFKVFPA